MKFTTTDKFGSQQQIDSIIFVLRIVLVRIIFIITCDYNVRVTHGVTNA